MKLGKVVFNLYYVVDLDNPQMVGRAMDMIRDDIEYATKYDEIASYIEVVDANVPYPIVTEADIHSVLVENEDD